MQRFRGFADTQGKFFKALAKHQSRDWFLAHRDEYEDGWNAPMKLLLSDVRAAIDRTYAHCDLDEPKVMRIFRDVRFSKDKSPYKTHIAGHVSVKRGAGAESGTAALYLHVGDDGVFAAAGHYQMDPAALARYRAAVIDDARGKELDKLVARLAKKGYRAHPHDALKRVPRGFDPDHPRAELLKGKDLIVSFPDLPRRLLTSPALVGWLAKASKDVAPLVEWLVFATA